MATSEWPISFVNTLSMAKSIKISTAAFYLELHYPQYAPVFSILDFSVAHPTGSFLFTIQSRCVWSFVVINTKTFYHCLVVKVYCWGKLVLTCLVMSLKLVLFFVLFCFVFDGYPFKFPFSWKNSLYICFTKVFVISYNMVWHTEEVWLLNWIFRKNDGIRRFSWGDVSWIKRRIYYDLEKHLW